MEITRGNALDILASVVSSVQQASSKKGAPEHRVSCHRCGNIRKRKLVCPRSTCPHIFCGRCADKMKEEHGNHIFLKGCPVCLELCCCSSKTIMCSRQNHCYRKCPATKGKNFPKEDLLTESSIDGDRLETSTDFGMDAPALEILAQVISLPPNEGGNAKCGNPRNAQPMKRKLSDAVTLSEDTAATTSAQRDGNGGGFHSIPMPVPSAPGWTITNGMHHGVPVHAVNAEAHRLGGGQAPPSMVFPSPNLLALRKKTLENPTETPTMLLLGSANTDLDRAGSSYSAGPGAMQHSHSNGVPLSLTSSTAWHGPASPSSSDCMQERGLPFNVPSGPALISALSPREVTSANTPTLYNVLQMPLPSANGIDNSCGQQMQPDSSDSASVPSMHTTSLEVARE